MAANLLEADKALVGYDENAGSYVRTPGPLSDQAKRTKASNEQPLADDSIYHFGDAPVKRGNKTKMENILIAVENEKTGVVEHLNEKPDRRHL